MSNSVFIPGRFRALALFLVVMAWPFASLAGEEWTVEELMKGLSEVTHAQLEFRETRQSVFVITDITTEGNMEYRAPDYIEKNTLSPFKEKVVISGDRMEVNKEIDTGKMDEMEATQKYSVQSHPLLKAAVESIRALLAGNFIMLTDNYTMILDGERSAWNLSLAPRSEEILEHIQEIRLAGEEYMIREVITIQADGDESKLELSYLHLE